MIGYRGGRISSTAYKVNRKKHDNNLIKPSNSIQIFIRSRTKKKKNNWNVAIFNTERSRKKTEAVTRKEKSQILLKLRVKTLVQFAIKSF